MTATFAHLMAHRVRTRPGEPLVTYIDAASGERTELSATSLANAAAKIANAVLGEFDLEPGDVACLALPAHWQLASWCAGLWTAGCGVTNDPSGTGLVIAGPDRAGDLVAPGRVVQVVSMHPFGLPITEPLPLGCEDVTVTVRQQPDAFLYSPADGHAPAVAIADMICDQAAFIEVALRAGATWGVNEGSRLLVEVPGDGVESTMDPLDSILGSIAVPLACGASTVIVRHADQDQLHRIAQQERITTSAAPSR